MYAKTTILAVLLAVAPMAQAGDTAPHAAKSVAELARDSGLTERNVRMLLGARTPYAEYRCCYSRMLRQFKQSIGDEAYQRLANDGYVPEIDSRFAGIADQDKHLAAHVGPSAL